MCNNNYFTQKIIQGLIHPNSAFTRTTKNLIFFLVYNKPSKRPRDDSAADTNRLFRKDMCYYRVNLSQESKPNVKPTRTSVAIACGL